MRHISNFIEGTEFAVDEAHAIVFKNIIPNTRSADAHDIRGTYKVVANSDEMKKFPKVLMISYCFLKKDIK